MSRTIDERVVEMRFDNQHFEKNVATTMSTLEKFKQKLNLTGASKGLENVNAAASKFDLSGVGRAADTVGLKFNAMYTIADQALRNITNSAYIAGQRIVSALTLDPITTGFNEYELKMGSVQTIMASTGESLESVNGYLAELNEYSDKTIYSFSDMTQNIGKFTNAGVKLEDAVLAIKGISNEAALSGANANEAARAMYNFSQALSAGYVKLIDWKSIENANMATVGFKEELIKTAVEVGTLTKTTDGFATAEGKIITATKNFNDSLQDQWMTSDVLIKTLAKYASETEEIGIRANAAATEVKTFSQLFDTLKESAQSGWAQTWELLVGDFEEAKDLMTSLSKSIGGIIDGISDWRNNLVEGSVTSNWEKLASTVEKAGLSTEKYLGIITDLAKESGIEVDKLVEEYGSLKKVIQAGKIPADILTKALKKLLGSEKDLAKGTEKVTKTLEDHKAVVDSVIRGSWGNGADRIKKLTEAGYDWAYVQNMVNERLGSSVRHVSKLTESQLENADSLAKLSDEQLKAKNMTDEQIAALRELEKAAEEGGTSINDLMNQMGKLSGRDLIIQSFKNIGKAIVTIFTQIKEAWMEIFDDPITGAGIYEAITKVEEFTRAMVLNEEAAERFKTIVKGAFTVLDISWSLASASLMGGLKILNELLKLFGTDLGGVLEWVAEKIIAFGESVEGVAFIGAATKWADISKALYEVIVGVYNCVKAFLGLPQVQNVLKGFTDVLTDFFGSWDGTIMLLSIDSIVESIKTFFKGIEDWIKSLENSENLSEDIIKGIGTGIEKGLVFIIQMLRKVGDVVIAGVFSVLGIDPNPVLAGWNALIDLVVSIGKHIKDICEIIADLVPVSDAFTTFGDKALKAWNTLTSSFGSMEDLSANVDAFFENIKTWLNGLKETESFGKDFVSGLTLGIGNGLVSLVKTVWNLATTLLTTFTDFFGIESPSKLMMAMGGFIILGLIHGLQNGAGSVWEVVTLLADGIIGMFKNVFSGLQGIDLGTILMAAFTGGVIYVVHKLVTVLDKIVSPMEGLNSVFKAVKNTVTEVGEAIQSIGKAKALEIKSEALLNLAKGVAILVASLIALSLVKDTKQLIISVGIIAALSGILIGLAWAMNKLSDASVEVSKNGVKTGGFKAGLIAIAGSLLILALVVKIIGGIPKEQAIQGFAGLAAMLVGILAVFGAYALLAKKGATANLEKVGGMLMKIAGSMIILALLAKLIAGMEWTEMGKAAAGLGGLVAIIALMMGISKIGNTKKVGEMLMQIAGAMAILVLVSKLIIGMEWADMGKAAIGLLGLSGIMALLALIAKDKKANKIGETLLAMAGAMGILVIVAKLLAGMEWDEMAKAAVGLLGLSGIVAILVLITKLIEKDAPKIAMTLLALSVSIGILAAVTVLLGMIKMDGIMNGIVIMGYLSAFMALMIAATRGASDCKANLIVMTVAIAIMVGAVVLLSTIDDPTKLIGPTIVVTMLMGMFGLMVKMASNVTASIGTLVVMTIAIGMLGFVIYKLAELPVANVIGSAVALSVLMLALSASMAIISTTGTFATTAIPALASMVVVVGALALILGLLTALDCAPSLETALALSVLLLAMSAALVILSSIGAIATAAIVAAAAFDAVVLIIGGLLVAIGALMTYVPEAEEFLDKGISVLEKLCYGIGSAVGNIIAGFADGALSSLPGIADSLSDFMERLQPFITGISGIKESFSNGMKNLDDGIQAISLTSLLGLVSVGDSMESYSKSIAKVNMDAVSKSTKVVSELTKTINKLSSIDEDDADNFGKAVKEMSKVGFSKFIETFTDSTAVKDAANAGRKITDNLIHGLETKKTSFMSAAKNMGKSGSVAIKETKASFEAAGKDLGSGLVIGIRSKKQDAYDAGYALGQAAVQGEKDGQQSNSPSRLTVQAGKWLGEGLIIGMDAMTRLVYNTGRDLGDNAVNPISDTIARISELMSEDMDSRPTIRPVLDLSDISAGAGAINGLLNTNPSIGLMTNLGSIGSLTNGRQNGSDDIVYAINKLNKSLNNLPTGTVNNINGLTYGAGTEVADAVDVLVRATVMQGRV